MKVYFVYFYKQKFEMITLIQAQEIINDEIERFKIKRSPKELYEPVSYILKLGGKRIRPALTLLGCNLFSENISFAIYPALAIELFHNFTLIHDDIMDNANLRRGKQTIHSKWNNNVAILSGDAMCIMAYELLGKCEGKFIKEILEVFNASALRVCEGQQLDMNFETRQTVSEKEYLKMIELKTSELFAACLEIGAITGGANNENSELLYRFGINLGLAFQLQDDLLDVFGDESALGKEIGKDIVSNKKTYLLVKALEIAKGTQREILNKWIAASNYIPKEKISAVQNIYINLGIKEITINAIGNYYSKALKCLNKITISDDRKHELMSFLDSLKNRKS